jgi:hypothetical protein
MTISTLLIEFSSFAMSRATTVAVLEKEPDPGMSSLAVSPDGRRLNWSQIGQAGSDMILMENFR